MTNLVFDSRVNYLKHAERFEVNIISLNPLTRATITHNHNLGFVPLVKMFLEGEDGRMRGAGDFTSNSNDLKLKSLKATDTQLIIKIDNLDASNSRTGVFYGIIYYERATG